MAPHSGDANAQAEAAAARQSVVENAPSVGAATDQLLTSTLRERSQWKTLTSTMLTKTTKMTQQRVVERLLH